VHYRFREVFEPNAGYRFFRNRRSILIQSPSTGQRFTETQIVSFTETLDQFLDSVQGRQPRTVAVKRLLGERDFPALSGAPLYKYVSEQTWDHIRRGSFQLGSAVYYRTTENLGIRDDREGAGHFFLQSGNAQVNMTLTAGFNTAIFCGTDVCRSAADHELMIGRFGGKLLKIEPVDEFTKRLKRRTLAFRTRMHDVVYTDTKGIVLEHDKHVARLRQIMMDEGMHLRRFNSEFFGTFYDLSLLPTLCAKPSSYAVERERRIIFEMRDDLKRPTLIVNDKSLLDFVTVVAG
jgi:hypothetical protein